MLKKELKLKKEDFKHLDDIILEKVFSSFITLMWIKEKKFAVMTPKKYFKKRSAPLRHRAKRMIFRFIRENLGNLDCGFVAIVKTREEEKYMTDLKLMLQNNQKC
jgi:RNase P protein component